jgi:hypothetical protein
VSECDREASIMTRPWPTGGLLRHWGYIYVQDVTMLCSVTEHVTVTSSHYTERNPPLSSDFCLHSLQVSRRRIYEYLRIVAFAVYLKVVYNAILFCVEQVCKDWFNELVTFRVVITLLTHSVMCFSGPQFLAVLL